MPTACAFRLKPCLLCKSWVEVLIIARHAFQTSQCLLDTSASGGKEQTVSGRSGMQPEFPPS